MMKSRILNRRHVLKGGLNGALVTLALPSLEAMMNAHGTAYADGSPFPKRFGTWFFGNGVKPQKFFPKQTGSNWELTPETQPLAGVKQAFTLVSGTNCLSQGLSHHSGQAGMLTGSPPTQTANDGSNFRRPSIDYIVSQQWKGKAKFDLINIAVHQEHRYQRGTPGHISHNGSSFNPNETSVGRLYDRLFGAGLPSNPGGAEAELFRKQASARGKVLDAVLADEKELRQRLGAADRQRLEKHLDGLVAVQKRIRELEAIGADGGGTCRKPDRPAENPQNDSALAPRNKAFADLLALALACDLTRVFSYQHHTWYSPSFREAATNGQQHAMTHDEPGDQPGVHRTNVFVMKQLATFIDALNSVKEGAGSVLDNSLVFVTSEVTEGRTHAKVNMPVIIAGRAGGSIRSGLHLREAGTSSYRIHVSIFKALGLPITSFGTTNETGTVSGLLT